MKAYYEAHITLIADPVSVKPYIESSRNPWKFSVIDGDPVLGEGIKCYATMFFNVKRPQAEVLQLLHAKADHLKGVGFNVVRRKIEKVIYDDKMDKVSCEGACLECVK